MTLPFDNNTGAITKKLANRSLKSEKRRNMMVIIAVALAAFLICFAGTLSLSMSQILKNQVTDTWEIVFTGATEDNVQDLVNVREFARVGGYYMVGAEDDTQGYTLSFVYSDSETLYMFRDQMSLEEGNLPEAANEIAVSSYFLSRFAPDVGIGDTIRMDTASFQGKYTISGILSSFGEKETDTYGVLISKAMLQNWSGFDPAGYRAYVHFINDQSMDEDTMLSFCRRLADDKGLPVPGTNTQYFRFHSGFDANSITVIGVVAVLVLIGSSIVIQSIFRISVSDKIQSYGQLRTIGATQKQIKHMVRKEGRLLGIIGSASGAILGAAVSLVLLPKGFRVLLYLGMILLSIIICLFIVSISIRKPVKIAAGISPLEAIRYLPVQGKAAHGKRTHRKLRPVVLGFMNFTRDRKKSVSITVSLSVGGILLLVISSILLVRAPEMQARQYFPDGDYKIYLDADQPEAEIMAEGNPLNEDLKQEILSIDGVTDILPARKSVHAEFYTESESDGAHCDMLTEKNQEKIEDALSEGKMPADGRSILFADDMPETYSSIYVGATVELSFGEISLPVTVAGFYDVTQLPDGNGRLGMDSARIYATEELFHELLPEIDNFDYTWDIISDSEKAQTVESGLENIVAGNATLALDTFGEKVEYYEQMDAIGFGSFQVLSWLIFLFGIVNLINTTLSNQMARRQENTILRSVGLTGKQLYRMIVCEGLCYALTAVITTVLIGLPISLIVCRVVSAMTYGGKIVDYQFPFFEMCLFAVVLLALEFFLSLWTIRRQKKQSLIEQLRDKFTS